MQRRDEQQVAQGGGGTQLSHTARAPEASPLPCPAPSNLPRPHPSSEPLRPLSPPQPPNACVAHTRQQVNPAAPWMALLRTGGGGKTHTFSPERMAATAELGAPSAIRGWPSCPDIYTVCRHACGCWGQEGRHKDEGVWDADGGRR